MLKGIDGAANDRENGRIYWHWNIDLMEPERIDAGSQIIQERVTGEGIRLDHGDTSSVLTNMVVASDGAPGGMFMPSWVISFFRVRT